MSSGGRSGSVLIVARALALLAAVVIIAAACTAESTVTAADVGQQDDAPDAADEQGADDAAATTDEPAEPADVTDVTEPAEPVEPSDPDDQEDGAIGVELPPPPALEELTLGWILGFDPDNRFVYDSVSTVWDDFAPCGQVVSYPIIGIDIDATSSDDSISTFAADLDLPGAPWDLRFDSGGDGALLTRCGEFDAEEYNLVPIRRSDNGTLTTIAEPVPLPFEEIIFINLGRMMDDVTVQVDILFGDPTGNDAYVQERRVYDLSTGEFAVTERAEDGAADWLRGELVTSPDGRFRYQEIEDPVGSLGCEGFGVSATLGIDDGSGVRPVFGPDQPAYSGVYDIHFGPDGLIAWSSGCEGYTTLTVGRMLDDGSIVDQHYVDVFAESEDYVEFASYRLTSQGDVIALGQGFDDEGGSTGPVVQRFSLADDPDFVNTGDAVPDIDQTNPLATTLAGTGAWFIGESFAADPGCGSETLYASTTAGFVRGVPAHMELDTIVDFDVTEERTVDYGDGFVMTTRTVVVLTECPGEATRLWFGTEPEIPAYGFYFEEADIGNPVQEVRSLRVEPVDEFFVDVFADVLFEDGAEAEILLVAVPYNG